MLFLTAARDSDHIKIDCKSGKKNDSIKFDVTAGKEGTKVTVTHKDNEITEQGHTKTETKFHVFFDKLIEYVPLDDNTENPYSWNGEHILTESDLSEWDEFTAISIDETESVYNFAVTTSDGIATLKFKLNTTVDDNKQYTSANKIKIDVEINNFLWSEEQVSDTNVALISTVKSETKMKTYYKKGKNSAKSPKKDSDIAIASAIEKPAGNRALEETSLIEPQRVQIVLNWTEVEALYNASLAENAGADSTVSDGQEDIVFGDTSVLDSGAAEAEADESDFSPFGDFSWVTEANVTFGEGDVIEKAVKATSASMDEDSLEQTIAFSFLGSSGSSKIYWDPQVGVSYTIKTKDSSGVAPTLGSVLCRSLISLAAAGMLLVW